MTSGNKFSRHFSPTLARHSNGTFISLLCHADASCSSSTTRRRTRSGRSRRTRSCWITSSPWSAGGTTSGRIHSTRSMAATGTWQSRSRRGPLLTTTLPSFNTTMGTPKACRFHETFFDKHFPRELRPNAYERGPGPSDHPVLKEQLYQGPNGTQNYAHTDHSLKKNWNNQALLFLLPFSRGRLTSVAETGCRKMLVDFKTCN